MFLRDILYGELQGFVCEKSLLCDWNSEDTEALLMTFYSVCKRIQFLIGNGNTVFLWICLIEQYSPWCEKERNFPNRLKVLVSQNDSHYCGPFGVKQCVGLCSRLAVILGNRWKRQHTLVLLSRIHPSLLYQHARRAAASHDCSYGYATHKVFLGNPLKILLLHQCADKPIWYDTSLEPIRFTTSKLFSLNGWIC